MAQWGERPDAEGADGSGVPARPAGTDGVASGRIPNRELLPEAEQADLSGLAELAEPRPAEPGTPRPAPDMVGVAAVAVGFVGIVVFGILAALVAGILGGWAGQRARDAGRSMELAYLAIILAGVDGIVWIALHLLFDIPVQLG